MKLLGWLVLGNYHGDEWCTLAEFPLPLRRSILAPVTGLATIFEERMQAELAIRRTRRHWTLVRKRLSATELERTGYCNSFRVVEAQAT